MRIRRRRSVDENEKDEAARELESFIENARKPEQNITQEEVFCITDDKPVSEDGSRSKDNTTKKDKGNREHLMREHSR